MSPYQYSGTRLCGLTLAQRWPGAGLALDDAAGLALRIASQLHFPALVQATTAQRAAGRRQAAVSVRRSIPAPGGQQPATGGSNGLPRAPSLPPSVAPSQPLLCRTPVRFSSLPPPRPVLRFSRYRVTPASLCSRVPLFPWVSVQAHGIFEPPLPPPTSPASGNVVGDPQYRRGIVGRGG